MACQEIEIWARECLNNGEANQEISRRNPTRLNNIFTQERNDDRATSKDNRTCEIHVCEEVKWSGWIVQNSAGDKNSNKQS